MAGKEPDIGPTARTVAANVKKLREDWDMKYTDVSERLMKAASWSINAVGIRRIESGERRVTPDDLAALAVAFGVSPATLLMPDVRTVSADDEVEVTGLRRPLRAAAAWEWISGRGMPSESDDIQDYLNFINRACPGWIREAAAERYREVSQKMFDDLTKELWPGQRGGGHGDD
ncbi:putative DNA binding protein [Mycobacteroides abscessus subsp. bolletii]|uniref:helix-turn-helix domain-containing protein n=1 Tax=Mycobacteroides abscessus TaxID=36809 RepID=UPI000928ACDA|nr:helix-turn-helix transcriptional regulator [Mycobacteroides abscessus]SII80022.1 putative DNA binding protein [Mycobacteroides abscessus subsp. bolletii]SLD55239.1 putative DNA binding protein [Mycobacteroides abscessus subsp. bolletii]SLE99210.1 putative DNA binding protein [Mycobacteroides abscessus subsp. bolletii]